MSNDNNTPQIHGDKRKSTRGVVVKETLGRVLVLIMPSFKHMMTVRARWEEEPYIKELGTTGNACWVGELWTSGSEERALTDGDGDVLEFGEGTLERLMQLAIDLLENSYDENLNYIGDD